MVEASQRGVAPGLSSGNIVRTIFYSTSLLFKAPGMLIKFKLKRRGAKRNFKKELIACGVPPWEADKLAQLYPFDLGDLMSLTRINSKN